MSLVVEARIRQLVKTNAEWLAIDPVILLGEWAVVKYVSGLEISYQVKVGDGVKKYSELGFGIGVGISPAEVNLLLEGYLNTEVQTFTEPQKLQVRNNISALARPATTNNGNIPIWLSGEIISSSVEISDNIIRWDSAIDNIILGADMALMATTITIGEFSNEVIIGSESLYLSLGFAGTLINIGNASSTLNIGSGTTNVGIGQFSTDFKIGESATVINIGESSLYLGLDSDLIDIKGIFRLSNEAISYEDDNIDPTQLTGGGNLPSSIIFAATTTHIAAFGPSAEDSVESCREIPHACKLNTPINFHVHYYPTTAGAGTVRFGLEYFFTREGIAVTASTKIYIDSVVSGIAWAKKSVSFADITPPNELGTQFHFRFFRDAVHINDTYASDIAVSTIGYHYQIDSFGSNTLTTKS